MQLVEIKKNNTGTGLLIENDGYISMDTGDNKKLYESIKLNEGLEDGWNVPKPFVVSAVFQKFDIENANGRIYPEAVLKAQVEKYMEKIADRRGYGECYKPDVKILTETGWKTLRDVNEGENIITLNPSTKKIELKPVLKKVHYDFEGKLVHIEGNGINESVTPDYKFPICKRDGSFRGFFTAEDIMNETIPDKAHNFIPKTGKWEIQDEEYFTIPAIESPDKRTLNNHPNAGEPLKIRKDLFMKFMGIYLSEGDLGKTSNYVRIHQKKENVCEAIQELFEEIGLPYRVDVRKNDGKKTFMISDPRLHKYLKCLGNCYTKYVPFEVKNSSVENLKLFYEWFVLGDGRIRGDKRKTSKLTDDVFSVSEQLALDLNEIQMKIGYWGSFHEEERNNDRLIEGRLIEGKNCHRMYFSLRGLTKGIYTDKRFIETTFEDYSGPVECVEVENHIWYVMSNGKCHWTGNCNHPEDSSINLSRIGMNIIELHWEGHTLVGKIEIPVTEGFRKLGIVSTCADEVANLLMNNLKIGVSSRGVGSVEQRYGKYMVGDDYELICWDVVSDPSTPNAWISSNEEELQRYVESKDKEKNTLLEKLNRFDSWLLK